MSSMLEQAIIDAAALREAALKNAEQSIIEKLIERVKEVEIQKHDLNDTISQYEELLQQNRYNLKNISWYQAGHALRQKVTYKNVDKLYKYIKINKTSNKTSSYLQNIIIQNIIHTKHHIQ